MKTIAITTLGLLLAGTLHAEELIWIKDGKYAGTQELAPGKFVELCGNIAAGERYAWKFDATGKVHFDIHYHVEDLVGKPAVLEGVREGASTFDAKTKQDYCWTWRNRTKESVKVTAHINKLP